MDHVVSQSHIPQDLIHKMPIYSIECVLRIGTQKYTGSICFIGEVNQIKYLDDIIPRFMGGDKPYLI